MNEEAMEKIVEKYVKGKKVIAVGSNALGENFLKKLAIQKEFMKEKIEVIPTSHKIAMLCNSLGFKTCSLNEKEIDLAVEFAEYADKNYNFVKKNSDSFVRDKMIAQSAEEMIAVINQNNLMEKLSGIIPFEVVPFGWKRTLMQLQSFGNAKLKEIQGKPFKTETGNYVVETEVDKIYSLDELEYMTKNIPGVIETGLFIGYADRIILYGKEIEVKSRMEYK